MKSLIHWSTILLSLCILLGPATAMAQFLFTKTGTILTVNRDSINIDDAQYKLSPTVKVAISSNDPDNPGYMKGELDQLKAGNYVQITVFKINQRRYVDTIFLLNEASQKRFTGK